MAAPFVSDALMHYWERVWPMAMEETKADLIVPLACLSLINRPARIHLLWGKNSAAHELHCQL